MANQIKYTFKGTFIAKADDPEAVAQMLSKIALMNVTISNLNASAYRPKADSADDDDE